jgi:arsenate reductase
MMWRPLGILFLCVGNSARSQLAHHLAKKRFGPSANVQSAGSRPTSPHPLAIEVLEELGCDTTGAVSRNVNDVDPNTVDLVITLCHEEVCPIFLHAAEKLHWPFDDPAVPLDDVEEMRAWFRRTRDGIDAKLIELGRARNLIPKSELD